MKNLILFIGLTFALNVTGQTPYEKGMDKAFSLWKSGNSKEASNVFERISNAEKDNWIPAYYTAYINIMNSFGMKDEVKLKANLDKAKTFLDKAEVNSPNNPEIMIIQALRNTAFIAFDGQKYGMTLSGKNSQLYAKALQIAPKNPRVILGNAEWNMGAARFFGKSTEPYCKDVKRALELFKTEKVTEKYAPKWGKKRAEQVLQQCGQ